MYRPGLVRIKCSVLVFKSVGRFQGRIVVSEPDCPQLVRVGEIEGECLGMSDSKGKQNASSDRAEVVEFH